jgi:hypothetical protein
MSSDRREIGELCQRVRARMCRVDIIADPRIHAQATHQFAHQAQKNGINRSRVAQGESTRHFHGPVHDLDLQDTESIPAPPVQTAKRDELRKKLDYSATFIDQQFRPGQSRHPGLRNFPTRVELLVAER